MTDKQKCKSLTAKGEECKRNAVKSGFCAQHQRKHATPTKVKSAKKTTSVKKEVSAKHKTIYTLAICKNTIDFQNGKWDLLLATSKRLLRKEIENHLSHIKSLPDDRVKDLSKKFTSYKNNQGDTFKNIKNVYAVRLVKQKLRVK